MATNIPQDDFQKTALRLPKDLHARLHESAAEIGRSYNAEIIARLEASFTAQSAAPLAALQAELDQQRALAEQFRSAADMSDSLRALIASLLLQAMSRSPKENQHELLNTGFYQSIADWLNERDPRGAVFSILRLVENADSGVVATLRKFAASIEDLGLYRRPIVIQKAPAGHVAPNRTGSVNKIILAGNIGRDPEVQYLAPKPPPNKGPVKRSRGKPPK